MTLFCAGCVLHLTFFLSFDGRLLDLLIVDTLKINDLDINVPILLPHRATPQHLRFQMTLTTRSLNQVEAEENQSFLMV